MIIVQVHNNSGDRFIVHLHNKRPIHGRHLIVHLHNNLEL